jgi:GLPGLI family protein
MKPFFVKDSMSIFNWQIVNEFKNVIGYKCQKATVDYRGRSYIAFFTTEIPFQTGPWKFCNLPGLILEVASIDNVFKITANKLQIKRVDVKIENPYKKKLQNCISWQEFIFEYKRKYNQLLHYRSPNGGTRSIPEKNIETYIE